MNRDKIFFDTCAYNHLNEIQIKQLTDLKNANRIEILTSEEILGQLVATHKVDVEKGKKLIGVYERLISHRVFNNSLNLLWNEVKSFNDGKRRSIYTDSKDNKRFQEYIYKFKNGIVDNQINDFIENNKKRKKEHLKRCRQISNGLDPSGKDKLISQCPDFESYYKYAIQRGTIRNGIKVYLEENNGIINPQEGYRISEITKKLEKHLNKLPHLRTYLRLNGCLSYRYNLQEKKEEYGDVEDVIILIAATTCDIYVSDDGGAREMASLLFPDKKVLSLEEFLEVMTSR